MAYELGLRSVEGLMRNRYVDEPSSKALTGPIVPA